MNFDFANPEFLWGLLFLPVLALLRGASGKSGSLIFSSVAVAKIASKKNKSSAGFWKFLLTLIALALLIIALARPRIGMGYSEKEESGIDIVLTIDVSGSMAGLDFSAGRSRPLTRLDAVKEVVNAFIEKRPNDRLGMVTFAANSFLVSPMTLNHDWLKQNLERIEIGVIDANRTAIGSAIGMSVNRLRDLKKAKSRVIILLTDGENNAGKISPIAAAEAASTYDTKIYTIAAGRSGIVPAAALNDKQQVVRDRAGNPVYGGDMRSEVDEETLKKISEITGGKFYRATNLKELQNIYADIDRLEKTTVKLRNFTSYRELFQYFAGMAIAILALKLILANTKFRTLP
ncbi:MAG: VWA domain-containing protein [Opitutales bacterium]|nr:VWA domain-containing protein [Opitutales bacterium]